jgi:xanthine dehydrogenase accessory factor
VKEVLSAQTDGLIPVLIDSEGKQLPAYDPVILIDARLLKKPVEQPYQAALTIGLGPGFAAGENCDAVIETNRGHHLGRVIWDGNAEPNTGIPGKIAGVAAERVLRAPVNGTVQAREPIGALIAAGQIVATVDGTPVVAPIAGVLRGLVHDGLSVTAGAKIGDIDARGNQSHCFTISDKALAIGGGVLEAVLSSPKIQALIAPGRDSG